MQNLKVLEEAEEIEICDSVLVKVHVKDIGEDIVEAVSVEH